MAAALIRLGILLLLVFFGWRLYQRLRGLPVGSPSPLDTPRPRPPRLKVVELKREPYEVLGLQPDASPVEVRAARDRLLEENDPERVAHMSPEVRAAARRVCEEVQDAYEALTGSVH